MKRFLWKDTEYNGLILALFLAVSVIVGELMFILHFSVQVSFFALLCDSVIMLSLFLLLDLIPKPWLKRTAMLTFFMVCYACTIIETVYFDYYNGFSSIRTLTLGSKYVGKADLGVRFNISTYLSFAYFVLAVVFASLIPLKKRLNGEGQRAAGKRGTVRFTAKLITYVTLFYYTAVLYGGAASAGAVELSDDAFIGGDAFVYQTIYNSGAYVGRFGYWSYRIHEAGYNPAISETDEIDRYFNGKSGVKEINGMTLNRDGGGATDGYYNGYNVINIVSETLDTRIIDAVITPNLYGLVYGQGGAEVYDDYYVPHFLEGSTINSEFMAMTGLYPVSATMWCTNMGVMYSGNSYDRYSLPAQLRAAGYDTYFMHNEYMLNYSRDVLMPNLGFEACYFYEDMSGLPQYADDPAYKWPMDSELARFAGEYVFTDENTAAYTSADNPKNFYIEFMTYSMHSGRDTLFEDYMPVVRDRFKDAGLSETVLMYFAKAMEYDKFLGDLIALLENKGLLENTLINIYPDHYVYTVKELYAEYLTGVYFDDFSMHKQKLIMLDGAKYGSGAGTHYSSAEARGTKYTVGSTADITPTVLNRLLGTKAEYRYFMGNDIMDGSWAVFPNLGVYNETGYITIDGAASEGADVSGLKLLQAGAFKSFRISQGIHENNYFKG